MEQVQLYSPSQIPSPESILQNLEALIFPRSLHLLPTPARLYLASTRQRYGPPIRDLPQHPQDLLLPGLPLEQRRLLAPAHLILHEV